MKPNKPFKFNPPTAVVLKPSKFVHYKGVEEFRGLSTDELPMNAANGSEFLEMDTGKKYLYSATNARWYEQPSSGGSGGGSVEPLIVEATAGEGEQTGNYVLNIPSISLYNQYITGKPVFVVIEGNTRFGVITRYSKIVNVQKFQPDEDDITSYIFSLTTLGFDVLNEENDTIIFRGDENQNPVYAGGK